MLTLLSYSSSSDATAMASPSKRVINNWCIAPRLLSNPRAARMSSTFLFYQCFNTAHLRKLYPDGFDVPDDSDYDNQSDVKPVVTDLMLLEKQDVKLRADYAKLPQILYVFMLFH